MPSLWLIIAVVLAGVSLPLVLRARRKGHQRFLDEVADREVCDHLKPAIELLKLRGHLIVRAGQKAPDFPMEIHFEPRFDATEVFAAAGLQAPADVSERGVILCPEHWCELGDGQNPLASEDRR